MHHATIQGKLMPSTDLHSRRMSAGQVAGGQCTQDETVQDQRTLPSRSTQKRLRGWLRDIFLSSPPSQRCQRWALLRALQRELKQ